MFRRTFMATVIGASLAIAGATSVFADGHGKKMDIVDTAVDAGSFTTLVAAVQAAGLVDTLKGEGPFTVFAPTDAAFAALPEGTVENLLKPENKDQLVQILTYHVVPAKVMAGDIDGKKAKVLTVEGERLDVNARNGVKVNDAKVTAADITASNGVIHVIDKVLIPGT
ncbi:fasciclin domain-containing protein [Shimia sp. R9_1]|uniref:fasciclin domain-containing protein n=1 Tax=unclassified Shimia TaxID=2630038 RepID=UPI001ADC18FF|nr:MULTISPECIES: fasciclin domain-containing protein [unclassified Shimia]MBO9395805.1 fasciclin domain-containing protein [Shimia sp. R9_2]MBO9399921.1 fasciclin domain-containing protein [Shimia sp. R9_3]MBO9407819.1 fasciclin domain-containing protein [Shimia sp. R9_1]